MCNPEFGIVISVATTAEVSVLLVKFSEPASVAKVPVVGSVTFVAPEDVSVMLFAPDVARVEPLARVSVPVVEEIVAPFTEVGVIAPRVNVMAGVVVAVATEPDIPLAVTTETLVTVPEPPLVAAIKRFPSASTKSGRGRPVTSSTPSKTGTWFASLIASVINYELLV
jgi:hypothetical protein